MIRNVLAALAGYAAWTALWLGGNTFFFAEAADVVGAGEFYGETLPLASVVGLSVVCSLVAGLVAAAIARRGARAAVTILSVLLLATGIAVQAGVWTLMPLWYHLAFLALLVPFVFVGKSLVRSNGTSG